MVLDVDSGYDTLGACHKGDSSHRQSREMRGSRGGVMLACGLRVHAAACNPVKMRYNDDRVYGRLERGPRWIQEVFA